MNLAFLSKRSFKVLIILFFSAYLVGCSTYAVNRYSVSVDNVMKLKKLTNKTIQVGQFTAEKPGQTEIMCRGVGPISTPDGESFETFIKKSLIDELKMADVYDDDGDIELTGHVEKMDFSSFNGVWKIILKVKASNQRQISIDSQYDFKTSFYGETACNQTAQALMPAVQDLIGKLINHQQFPDLLK